jgi:hypothetical protein
MAHVEDIVLTNEQVMMIDTMNTELATADARANTAEAEVARLRDEVARLHQELEDARAGDFGDVDLREYCECCNRHWNRDYVTWFAHPYETDDGRSVNSACGQCYDQVPEGHEPMA